MEIVKSVRFPSAVITKSGSTTVAILLVIDNVFVFPDTLTVVAWESAFIEKQNNNKAKKYNFLFSLFLPLGKLCKSNWEDKNLY